MRAATGTATHWSWRRRTTTTRRRSASRRSNESLRVIERFTRTSDDRIDYQFTVDNPAMYTRQWTAILPMARVKGRFRVRLPRGQLRHRQRAERASARRKEKRLNQPVRRASRRTWRPAEPDLHRKDCWMRSILEVPDSRCAHRIAADGVRAETRCRHRPM